MAANAERWPSLPLEAWRGTYAAMHLWLQMAGKVRLALSPWQNHSWHVTLYPTATGLTTSPIPHDGRAFDIVFDFIEHRLDIRASDGRSTGFALGPGSVAGFYRRFMEALATLDIRVAINPTPSEIADPVVPFDRDDEPRPYDADYANRFWRILIQSTRVFTVFRGRFIGKCSPVHVFWGAPDLAVTRFSGRTAPQHRGGIPHLPDSVAREAYSHEVSSCGFWPGGGPVPYPAYYAYAYPEPAGFKDTTIRPAGALYSEELGEFLLPYDAVRESPSPDDTLLEFLQTTYEAAADLGKWDRAALESHTPIRR